LLKDYQIVKQLYDGSLNMACVICRLTKDHSWPYITLPSSNKLHIYDTRRTYKLPTTTYKCA